MLFLGITSKSGEWEYPNPVIPIPSPPSSVKNKYILDKKNGSCNLLGEGAYGRVYLAYDQDTSRTVAVKILRPFEPDNSIAKNIMLCDQVPRRFKHRNIIAMLDDECQIK